MEPESKVMDGKSTPAVTVLVEIPKGSRNKDELDRATGRLRFDVKGIEHFFPIHKELEAKKTGVEDWENREGSFRRSGSPS